jgi:guanylate kinase
MKKGRIFVISAPSGTGKSTVVEGLLHRFPHLAYSVSCTTRSPRVAEHQGVDYHFVDRDTFMSMRQDGEFVEWAEVHGELYGTPRQPLKEAVERGLDIVLDIDVQGGLAIKDAFPEAVTIFLLPPSFEVLKERLAGRGTDSPEQIRIRLENARNELSYKDRYDHHIINDEVSKALDELAKLIHSTAPNSDV